MVKDSAHNGRLKFLPECPLDKLKPYEENPRRNDEAVQAVAQSIDSDVWGLTIDVEKIEPMDSDAASRALALLTHWALRQAEKQRSPRVWGAEEGVTIDVSKGSGDEKGEN